MSSRPDSRELGVDQVSDRRVAQTSLVGGPRLEGNLDADAAARRVRFEGSRAGDEAVREVPVRLGKGDYAITVECGALPDGGTSDGFSD